MKTNVIAPFWGACWKLSQSKGKYLTILFINKHSTCGVPNTKCYKFYKCFQKCKKIKKF